MVFLTFAYRKLLEFRFYIAIALILITTAFTFTQYNGWWWFLLSLTILAVGSHVFFGPIRFIQEAIQNEDFERAEKHINTVLFPKLLFKPVRQGFYMLKSNLAMVNKDLSSAENMINKSIKSKSKLMGANEGASYLQLGLIAIQNGNKQEGKKSLRLALEKGLPDIESKAAAYVQLGAIELQSRKVSQARNLLNKAKKLNPQSSEIKGHMKELEKHINGSGMARKR